MSRETRGADSLISNSGFILYNLTNGKFHAKSGMGDRNGMSSYTSTVMHAEHFRSIEEAERNACSNEVIYESRMYFSRVK